LLFEKSSVCSRSFLPGDSCAVSGRIIRISLRCECGGATETLVFAKKCFGTRFSFFVLVVSKGCKPQYHPRFKRIRISQPLRALCFFSLALSTYPTVPVPPVLRDSAGQCTPSGQRFPFVLFVPMALVSCAVLCSRFSFLPSLGCWRISWSILRRSACRLHCRLRARVAHLPVSRFSCAYTCTSCIWAKRRVRLLGD